MANDNSDKSLNYSKMSSLKDDKGKVINLDVYIKNFERIINQTDDEI